MWMKQLEWKVEENSLQTHKNQLQTNPFSHYIYAFVDFSSFFFIRALAVIHRHKNFIDDERKKWTILWPKSVEGNKFMCGVSLPAGTTWNKHGSLCLPIEFLAQQANVPYSRSFFGV